MTTTTKKKSSSLDQVNDILTKEMEKSKKEAEKITERVTLLTDELQELFKKAGYNKYMASKGFTIKSNISVTPMGDKLRAKLNIDVTGPLATFGC